MKLRIYYQNVRGIRSKTNDLLQAIKANDYNVIILTESWLKEGIFNREFIDDRYEVLRRDRSRSTSSKSDGGGVVVAIIKSPRYTIINEDEWTTSSVEDLWFTLKPANGGKSISFSCVYIPGDLDTARFETYTENVALRVNSSEDHTFVVVGDFNAPKFASTQKDETTPRISLIREMMDEAGLEQFNTIRSNTISNNLLDLVFCNKPINVEECTDPLLKIDEYHPPLVATIEVNHTSIPDVEVKFRNYKRADWRQINNDLMNVNWPREWMISQTVDEKVQQFYAVIDRTLDKYCPEVTKRAQHHPCWFSRDTKRLLGKKKIFHQKWKRHQNQKDHAAFSKFRAQAKDSISKDFRQHNIKYEELIKSDPKAFWKFVNSKKVNGAGVSDYIRLGDKVAYNRKEAVELFAEHFSSVYLEDDATNAAEESEPRESPEDWTEIFIPMCKIYEKLQALDTKKAPGPDKLPPILFRRCATALTFPLFIIYNDSIRSGIFPSQWKLAHVTPIHKDNSPHDASNYRPISKLSIAAKIFDNILADELFERFQDVIIPQQHGFFRKRSTVTNLLDYTEKLQRSLDRAGQTDVIYTDFSKAFDKVSHSKLLEKLRAYGIRGRLLDWFKSYLTERLQKVQLGDFLSSPINVSSSIVQGSHIGPTLFSLFINDIGEILKDVNFCIFADDLKIFKEINTVNDAEILQINLDRLDEYVRTNHLDLNVKKCVSSSFTKRTVNFIYHPYKIRENYLERRLEMRDLGITFDSQLNFNEHIDNICKKARRMLGFIMRVGKNFCNPFTFTTLYSSLVRSNLEYASVIWNPHTQCQKQKIERIQHKFLHFVARTCFPLTNDVSYQEMESRLNLDTLALRRTFADVKFTTKSFNNLIDGSTYIHNFTVVEPNKRTRNTSSFQPTASRTDQGKFSVANRLMTTYNLMCDTDRWLHIQPDDNTMKNIIREALTEA